METSQETLVGVRAYRFSLGSQISYLLQGVIFVAIGFILLTRDYDSAASGRLLCWIIGVGFFLGAAYFAISAAYSVVLFDQESVTVRGVFSTQSIRKRSVSSYLVVPGSKNQAAAIRLISNSREDMNLDVPKLHAFDDAWKQWISSLSDRTQEVEAGFTLK